MSALAATQIPKPSDEQAFERASVVLWRALLQDPNVHRNGRRGQRQNGVDLCGIRNGDPTHHVGIQCKLKGDGHELTDKEVREEVAKALTFTPPLREYFIITTAPDDVAMQELARKLTTAQHAEGRNLLIYVWGWNTLEERISEHAEARKEFDPEYGPFSEQILEGVARISISQDDIRVEIGSGHAEITARLSRIEQSLLVTPGDTTSAAGTLEAHLDADIDAYRDMANAGRPRTALGLFEILLQRIKDTASGRILFRVKANIGSCLYALGEDNKAAEILAEAYRHAPTEPKAIANNALSLLLQRKWREALSFCVANLGVDPTNEWLAGYLVQAARFIPEVSDPLDLVPDAIKTSAPVVIGRVEYLRRRPDAREWRDAANAALAQFPDDTHARQFAAEADLDEILTSEIYRRQRLFNAGDRDRLQAAANVFLSQWNIAKSSEGVIRPETAAICGNLIVALHTLDDFSRAIEIAREALTIAPNDAELGTRIAAAAIDARDEDLAQRALTNLQTGPDRAVLSFRLYAAQNNFVELERLWKNQFSEVPESERKIVATAGRLAAIKNENPENVREKIEVVSEEASEDPRSGIVVAEFARREGFEDIAESSYRRALACINLESHVAARMMVAMHAAERGDWRNVADLLDGHVCEDHDSEELRTLARAHVNDTPIRHRAIRFFERLPRSVRDLPVFLHAEGLLHFNRGALGPAESALRKAIKADPHLTNVLALFSALRRSDRRKEIGKVLKSLDCEAVRGTPGQKMLLAQELWVDGQRDRALQFAYNVLESARSDPEAALRYFGLLMLDPTGRAIPRLKCVNVDSWVRLVGENGEQNAFLIVDGDDRPADGVITPKHPIAAAALGLKCGDEFSVRVAFGNDFCWKISEIKHKYLHALHDIMENFQTRFPDAQGIYRLTFREGDVRPALDQIRKTSERNRELANLYLLQHLPMAVVASHLGGDVVGFAGYIRSLGFNIETCVGTEPERRAAREFIVKRSSNGATLDTYTAWTVATLDAFDVITAVFGKVTVAQSTIDELRILRDKDEFGGGRSMTVAWRDGQFFREELSKADIAARRDFISTQIHKIQRACAVEPGVSPDSPNELASFLTDSFGAYVLDAVNLADADRLLVSEDLYFRQLAKATNDVDSVWLQPILDHALSQGYISRERCVDLTVKLAWRRHSHISIDPTTLMTALADDQSDDLQNFRELTEFIGTRSADMRSHLSVVSDFLGSVWRSTQAPDLKVMRATGILLERLIRFRQNDWTTILSFLTGSSNLDDYIEGWITGHFLDVRAFRAEVHKMSQIRNQILFRQIQRQRASALATPRWPYPHRR